MIVTISRTVARFFKVSHPHIPSNQPVNVGYSVCFGGSAALVGDCKKCIHVVKSNY